MKQRYGNQRAKPGLVRGSADDTLYSATVVDELLARRLYPVYVEVRHLEGSWVQWTFYSDTELERMRLVFRKMGVMLRVRYKRE